LVWEERRHHRCMSEEDVHLVRPIAPKLREGEENPQGK
jgi:hypothetical protein